MVNVWGGEERAEVDNDAVGAGEGAGQDEAAFGAVGPAAMGFSMAPAIGRNSGTVAILGKADLEFSDGLDRCGHGTLLAVGRCVPLRNVYSAKKSAVNRYRGRCGDRIRSGNRDLANIDGLIERGGGNFGHIDVAGFVGVNAILGAPRTQAGEVSMVRDRVVEVAKQEAACSEPVQCIAHGEAGGLGSGPR